MADDESSVKQAKGPGLMTLVKAIAFVSVLVLLQIAGASLIIPSAQETAEKAKELAAADLDDSASDALEETSSEEEDPLHATDTMVEVSLGAFHVLTQNIKSGAKTNVDFDLFATVLADDEGDFLALFEANKQRIREQVLVTLRGTEMPDLTDPTLGLIKRKILEKTNRALGKPLLHEAIFSKFSFEER